MPLGHEVNVYDITLFYIWKILEHGVIALIISPITACQLTVIVRAKVMLVKFVVALTRAVYIVLHFMYQLQQQRL